MFLQKDRSGILLYTDLSIGSEKPIVNIESADALSGFVISSVVN